MLTDATGRPRSRGVGLIVALGVLVAVSVLAVIGLWVLRIYSMSDPEAPVFGARAERGMILVKVPMCPADNPQRLEVQDYDAAASSNSPKVIWWASSPWDAAAGQGEVELFSGTGFRRSAPTPAPADTPRDIEVDYKGPECYRADAFDVKEITSSKLKPGQYWTLQGPMTAAQIDGQLRCGGGRSTQRQ